VKLRLRSILFISASLACLISGTRLIPAPPPDAAAKPLEFDRQIRPILADTCFSCHGPDEKQRTANLRLDETEGLFVDRGGYKIIVPGNPAQSKLYLKISSKDDTFRMPPVGSGRSLNEKQIELIKEWIEQGAKWEKHWAWIPPARPAVPEVQDKAWPRNPIDNFVLTRFEREGLKPSPEADKGTLLRRVTLDLTGLPPTAAELDSFLADKSPDAYEKRVGLFLASPHYGEKMAMRWLDLARYADSHGYHVDTLRQMWPWRDWVIRAFNANMPYDQFTIKQLAGDLLPDATLDDKIATGFNRNHMIDMEDGAIPLEYHTEYVVDRVSTTGTTWLGITIGCARCHDHKYDPILQKDFYRFFAFFNTVPERGLYEGKDGGFVNAAPLLQLPSPDQKKQLDSLESRISSTLAQFPEQQMVALQNQWRPGRLATLQPPSRDGLEAHYEFEGNLKDTSGHGQDATVARGEVTYDDGSVGMAGDFSGEAQVDFGKAGDFGRAQPFALALWFSPKGANRANILQKRDASPNWTGYEVAVDDPTHVEGEFLTPNFMIFVRLASRWPDDAIEIRTKERLPFAAARHLSINYDGSGKASGLKLYLEGTAVETEVVKDHLTGDFRSSEALSIGDKKLGRPFKGHIDDLRIYSRMLTLQKDRYLSVQEPARALLAELKDKPVEEIASLKPDKPPAEEDIGEPAKAMTKEQKVASLLADHQARLSEYFLTYESPENYRKLYAQLINLRDEKQKLEKAITTTMVMGEMTKPRDTFVLGRGQYDNPKEKVTPGVPSFLSPLPSGAPLNRLTLAKWIVDSKNPLTARVAVNRYWESFFGTGFVKTSEDFGSQGEPPSNPELLDWLATEFIRTGWNVKAMQRLILTSATYRQSSKATPEMEERDPENRLLARGPRFRLSAEEIRDNALAISGLLNDKIGGPSVYPYQPKGVWEEMSTGVGYTGQTYHQGTGPDLYRRSMYTVWKRTVPPAALTTFDAPDRGKCTAGRGITNTPLQALVLMNDPTYVEASRVLAEKTILQAGRDPQKRVDYQFRLATARRPQPQEREVLLSLVQQELAEYRHDKASALKLLSVGDSKRNPKLDPAEVAAWTTVASTILNLDETITKQ
jgi:hypothetical protein